MGLEEGSEVQESELRTRQSYVDVRTIRRQKLVLLEMPPGGPDLAHSKIFNYAHQPFSPVVIGQHSYDR